MEVPQDIKHRFTTAIDSMAARLKSYAAKPTADPNYLVKLQNELNAFIAYFNQAELVMQTLRSSGGVITFNAPRQVSVDNSQELEALRTLAAYYGWEPSQRSELKQTDFKDMRRAMSLQRAQTLYPELF